MSAQTTVDLAPVGRDDSQDKEHAPIRVDAPITAVEVFRGSALVHRSLTLDRKQWHDQAEALWRDGLEVVGLPLALADSTVRVAVIPADSPLSVLDVQVALDVLAPIEEQDVEEAVELRRLRRQHDALTQQQKRLHRQAEELLKLRPELLPAPRRLDREQFAVEDPVVAWLALGEVARELAGERFGRSRELAERLRSLNDEIQVAEDKLADLSTAAVGAIEVRKKLQLRLHGEPDGDLELAISYQVWGARWFPSYELRVKPDGAAAELAMSALVAQATGEDWTGVSLSLSTADLDRRCDLPKLAAWRIGRAGPAAPEVGWRPLPEDLPELFADYDRDRPPEQQPFSEVEQEEDDERQLTREVPIVAGLIETDDLEMDTYDADEEIEGVLYEEDTFTRNGFEAGSAPPAPGAVAEMSAPPAAFAAQLAAPEPSVARASMPMKKRSRRDTGLYGTAKAQSALAPGDDGPVLEQGGPTDELLSFGNLALAGGNEQDRGVLRPLSRQEQLPEKLREQSVIQSAIAESEQSLAGGRAELQRLPLPRHAREVSESAGHFAYRYQTGAPAEIPADARLHRIGVARQGVPIELYYRTVPQLDATAYRLARLVNPLSKPLLAGPLDIFWGNDYLVTAELITTAPGAKIDTSLGVEPRIKVARNVRHSEHEEGLLSGKTVYEEEVTIDVKNALSGSCLVEVIERIPITEERKLEIKVLTERPAAAEYKQEERQQPIRGGRRWSLELSADEEKSCRLQYRMTLSSSSEIDGGGRRA